MVFSNLIIREQVIPIPYAFEMDNLNFYRIKMRLKLFYVFPLILVACAPARFVKPLEHKQHAVSASLGGALVNIPGIGVMPIPHTSLGYGYGLKPKTTVYGNWYSTAAVFGVVQFDAGVTQGLWMSEDKRKGVSISPSINFMTDVFEKNTRVWPQLDANYYFDYFQKEKKERINTNHFYFGMTNWFEFQGKRAHDQKQTNRIIFSPQIGHVFERGKWNYSLEVKFLAPYASNEDIVVDYVSALGNRGGLGAYFGVNYKF